MTSIKFCELFSLQNKPWGDNQWTGAKPKTPSGSWGDAGMGGDWNQQGRRVSMAMKLFPIGVLLLSRLGHLFVTGTWIEYGVLLI